MSPNGGETVGEVTPSFGTLWRCERVGQMLEVQDRDIGTVSVRGRLSSAFGHSLLMWPSLPQWKHVTKGFGIIPTEYLRGEGGLRCCESWR